MPRPRSELPESEFAEYGDAVGPVEGDGADVEDAGDGGVGAQPDEVDDDAPEDGYPDCVEGSSGSGVYFGPDVGEGEEAVAGEGEDGAGKGLLGGFC